MRFVICVALLGSCDDREADGLDKVRRAVCACHTAACAELAMKDVPTGEIKSTHRAQLVARDMLDCLARLHEAERPSTDPDAPSAPRTSDPASGGTP